MLLAYRIDENADITHLNVTRSHAKVVRINLYQQQIMLLAHRIDGNADITHLNVT